MTTFKLSNNAIGEESVLQQKMKRQKKSNQEDIDKPKRKRITPEQFCLLTELFQQTDTPSHDSREMLAKKLNMTNREVQVWFQNRRAKVNRIRLQEQEEQIMDCANNKKVKFNYWSSNNLVSNSSSSSSSSLTSSPSLPHELIFHPDVTPIDILATAAAYVQQWDENELQRKRKQQHIEQEKQPKKYKSWRPWL
ncbi:homeobox domain-containing protein [Parasitella parasitica]|nr:homeobox domain-containing protein [Parasitella parasitica]